MILFFEKTWVIWWTVAVVVILYWFYKWSAHTEPEAVNEPFPNEKIRMIPDNPRGVTAFLLS